MAEENGVSLTDELDRIIEAQRRQRFLEDLATDYAALRDEETAWQDVLAERRALEGTLMDGLENDPHDFSGFAPDELRDTAENDDDA